jgi:hypothetical protein
MTASLTSATATPHGRAEALPSQRAAMT